LRQRIDTTKLIQLPLSGEKATIYSVVEIRQDGSRSVLFEQFIAKFQRNYSPELTDVVRRLRSIGNQTGARLSFFKLHEGLEADDKVCALYDIPEKFLRLYCIVVSEQIVIVGGGGPKTTRTWQEDVVLSKAVHTMMDVSARFRAKMSKGDLWLSPDGLTINGNLILSES
jgi:hypothetical protein